jgi:TrmH family RNA methyltransferase
VPDIVGRFAAARADAGLVILEGFHALKHAVRFGADVLEVAARDRTLLERLGASLAPDLELARLPVTEVSADVFQGVAPAAAATGVVALARRPHYAVATLLGSADPAPVLLLENTRRLENLGACIRIAAAAGAAGVIALGGGDPWHPAAIRGAAGLQFALPVVRLDELPPLDRPLIAFDAAGTTAREDGWPPRAVLAFGSERDGLSDVLRAAAHRRLRIPMRAGVSSLNVAAAVAVALYAWRRLGE